MELGEEGDGDLAHLGVRFFGGPHEEEVSPVAEVAGYDDTGGEGVGEDGAGQLGGDTETKKLTVGFLAMGDERGPDRDGGVGLDVRSNEGRGHFLLVVDEAGGLLGEGEEAVADEFVGDATIYEEAHGGGDVFGDGPVAVIEDDGLDETFPGGVGDGVLGAVGDATAPFDYAESVDSLEAEATTQRFTDCYGRCERWGIPVYSFDVGVGFDEVHCYRIP